MQINIYYTYTKRVNSSMESVKMTAFHPQHSSKYCMYSIVNGVLENEIHCYLFSHRAWYHLYLGSHTHILSSLDLVFTEDRTKHCLNETKGSTHPNLLLNSSLFSCVYALM